MFPQNYGLSKAAYTVSETIELLSIGRTSVYELVKTGELPPIKFGKKTLFAAHDLVAVLDKRRNRSLQEAGV